MSANSSINDIIKEVFSYDIQKIDFNSVELPIFLNYLLQIYCSNPHLAIANNRRKTFGNKWMTLKCNSLETELAIQQGFYFTGIDDETVCVSCGLGMKGWTDDDCPKLLHSTHSPNCPFVICIGLLDKSCSSNTTLAAIVTTNQHKLINRSKEMLNLINKFVNDKSGYAVDNARGLGHTDSLICLGSFRYLLETGNLPHETITLLRSIMILDDQLESNDMSENDLPAFMELLKSYES